MSDILHRLRSVVSQSGDILIITHQSFVDFLIDPLCPDDFRLRLETEEARLDTGLLGDNEAWSTIQHLWLGVILSHE